MKHSVTESVRKFARRAISANTRNNSDRPRMTQNQCEWKIHSLALHLMLMRYHRCEPRRLPSAIRECSRDARESFCTDPAQRVEVLSGCLCSLFGSLSIRCSFDMPSIFLR
jgi:hypothetical protein